MSERSDVGGYALAWEDLDGAGAHPVLLFHWGMFGDRELLRPLAQRLEGLGRRILVDGRGYGASDAPRQPYTLEGYAEDLARLIGVIAPAPAVLVGQSMGAMTALRVALAHPDLVAALVLLDTSAAPEEPEALPVEQALLRRLARTGVDRELLELVARASLVPPAFADAEPERVDAWARSLLDLDVEAFSAHALAVFDRGDLRPRLGEIACPALVVVGELDRATPPARSEELAEGLPRAWPLVRIPDAGHFAPWERPDLVAAPVRAFLEQLLRGTC